MMIHLRKFNEDYSKDIVNIEDLLIKFIDNCDITLNNIKESNGQIRINFKIDSKYRGLDKLKMVDEILERLHRRYKYTLINKGMIFIDIVKKENKKYVKSVSSKIHNRLNKYLTGLTKYTIDDTDVYKQDQICMFEYSKQLNTIKVNSLLILHYQYLLVDEGIVCRIIKDYIQNVLGLYTDVNFSKVGIGSISYRDFTKVE